MYQNQAAHKFLTNENKKKVNKYATANKQSKVSFSLYISSLSWTNLKNPG